MKYLLLLAIVLSFVGCTAEWPDYPESYSIIFEGPLSSSGYIEIGVFQVGIRIVNDFIEIESYDGPTINGITHLYIDQNGEHWVLLDTSSMVTGDLFSIVINGKTLIYEVI